MLKADDVAARERCHGEKDRADGNTGRWRIDKEL